MQRHELKAGTVLTGPLFPEPVRVILAEPLGQSVRVIAEGVVTGGMFKSVLAADQLAKLTASPEHEPFDGDPLHFRLGVEALRLGLAYEYDPYFSLSIARVDPLPHQLEAVYDYFLRSPRIRFLLADDPGAGKTIMAGLLVKELKIRGLVKRVLIVTPANLCFQWKRELKDKFRETFDVINSDVLRAQYGSNPWQDRNQVVTSVSWVSRIDDAKDSLLRSHWDLIIVDEAHKMSAAGRDSKTLAYQLGEKLSQMTDHFLLMTATPHKGDPDNFSLFLELLDPDVYGDVASLEEAMRRREAPFYLRRVKEALVTFPDPETGKVQSLFTKRIVRTQTFELTGDEYDLYHQLTEYVEKQSIRAAQDDSARGRALTFTMAMLQRRFASSVYALRRSLERMRDKRQKILDDPEKYRRDQIQSRMPDDYDELPEDEQDRLWSDAEGIVASLDPADLRDEIQELARLIDRSRQLEKTEVESKLQKLKQLLTAEGVFADPAMKLLVFTEHKDTLDYLAGDGKDGRPLGKLREWGLKITQIHGGMKIGDRDTPGTRIYAEREFKEEAQVLAATEAAGEGINLQFCWLMVNYDIPWNPMRLEQRMGRIHRYGQEKDCLIFNFVSTSTREGRVLHRLFDRLENIERDLDPQQTGKVFNVLGDVFPSNQLEKMLRDMYAHNQMTEALIKARIVELVDTERFRRITASTLEGLAKRELNLSAIVGKSAEAKERRLVPEVIEDFFVHAGPLSGVHPKETPARSHTYRVGKLPRTLLPVGEQLEPRFGKLGREYPRVVFDKELLKKDSTLEWVTPGHPLFEVVRDDVINRTRDALHRGTVYYDLHAKGPYLLTVFSAAINDGRGHTLHRRLFAVRTDPDGAHSIRQPTVFLDLSLAPVGTAAPDPANLPPLAAVEQALVEQELNRFLVATAAEREKEIATIARHVDISLNELIHRQNLRHADLQAAYDSAPEVSLNAANLKTSEDRLDELTNRLERRQAELAQERQASIGNIQFVGRAWVLPHPERDSPTLAGMVQDDEIEKIAVRAVTDRLHAEGWDVQSVESENRGYDLRAKRGRGGDPDAVEIRFVEVKGRAGVGEVALTDNEYKTAARLTHDYWLYVVYNCASRPEIHPIHNPARLKWQPVVRVEHYLIKPDVLLQSGEGRP